MKHAEYAEQVALFEWLEIEARRDARLKYAFSSQAGEKFKNAIAGARAKKAGMKAGVPDIFIPVPTSDYHGLFIEMKRRLVKGEPRPRLSEAQKEFIGYLNEYGYLAIVCFGATEAILAIKSYLQII